ncbi:uncharacterized protein EDB91DRAFT_1035962, partial [Suillus paluster]|uniref:uncharacterized protein n=1 Tax=Suillus paluster TaxID=48578 RepID=UPI001B868DF1
CPAFLIAQAGSWLAVLGTVLTEKCVIQRLMDYIWILAYPAFNDDQVLQIGYVLYARRESRKEPPYDTSRPVAHAHFFPTPDIYICNSNSHLGRHPSCVTYLAKTVEDHPINVVLKFVTRYGEDAHKVMAEAGFEPKILYCGQINVLPHTPSYGRLQMIVMEYVDIMTA